MRGLLCLLFLLASCVATPQQTQLTQTYVYDCEGGYRLTARAEGAGLWLFLPAETKQLSVAASESGQLFTAAGIEFWKRGEEAQLSIEGQIPRQCRSDLAAAIWEDAKFRGVDFRASGNEPGWFVELDREKILYAGNYGQTLLTFPAVPPQRDVTLAESRYLSSVGEHSLNMLLQSGDCYDSMSGEPFRTRVTLELDGQILYGCGRALH